MITPFVRSWVFRSAIGLVCVVAISGCSSRSEVTLDAAEAARGSEARGLQLTVVDERRLPSLGLSSEEIARLAAEYRGSVELLPEGQTVSLVVEQLVLRAFRKSSLRDVVDAASGSALPVRVEIEQFLGRGHDDPFTFRVGFSVQARVTAPIDGFRQGQSVSGGSNRSTYYPPIARMFGGPRTSAWKTVIDAGCDEFVDNLAVELEPR